MKLIYLGLFATVGFSLSLSPINSNPIAHNSHSPLEYVSIRQPSSEEFDLGEFNTKYKGIRVKSAISKESNKALYHLEGRICTDCVGVNEVTLDKGDTNNIDFIKMALAKSAIELLEQKTKANKDFAKTTSNPTPKSNIKPKAISNFESLCDDEDKEGLMTCIKEEFLDLVEECENIDIDAVEVTAADKAERETQKKELKKLKSQKTICLNNAEKFYSKNLKKLIDQGLRSPVDSTTYLEAVETRDELISDLPERFDNSIRAKLVSSTTNGVLEHAYQNYQMATLMGAKPEQAAAQAKLIMLNEMNYQNPFSAGGLLYNSLLDYSATSSTLSQSQAQTLFSQSFHIPLYNFFNKDHKNGITPLSPLNDIPSGNMPTLSDDPQNSGANPSTSRPQGQRSSTQTLPAPFGTPKSGANPLAARVANTTSLNNLNVNNATSRNSNGNQQRALKPLQTNQIQQRTSRQ